jgi:hypothetical protein
MSNTHKLVIEIGDVKRSAGLGEARDNVSWNHHKVTSWSSPGYTSPINHRDDAMTITFNA